MTEGDRVERILRTRKVDGQEVAVIEVIEEDASSFVLFVDDSVIDADAPRSPRSARGPGGLGDVRPCHRRDGARRLDE
jgi:hypothetical protein